MKKKFPLIGAFLMSLLLVCVMLESCKNGPAWVDPAEPESASDSVLVAQYIDRVSNPTFINTNEVITFRNRLIENVSVDSLITALPEKTLVNVAGVVINKFGTATKLQIADEYRANRSVYENLPKIDTSPQQSITSKENTQMEDATTRVGTSPKVTSVTFRDTVINGKKYKVETKIAEYE